LAFGEDLTADSAMMEFRWGWVVGHMARQEGREWFRS
jgi:hypothetical protein